MFLAAVSFKIVDEVAEFDFFAVKSGILFTDFDFKLAEFVESLKSVVDNGSVGGVVVLHAFVFCYHAFKFAFVEAISQSNEFCVSGVEGSEVPFFWAAVAVLFWF